MRIIDRYLLRQFVQIFLICFFSMTGLYVVIDAFGHLDDFSNHADQQGNLMGVIAEYYAYRSLSFFDRTAGILAMLSAMFTVTWLGRHQELTALLAAGISKVRILKPLLMAAVVVSLLGVLNRELVIPQVRDELMRDTKDLSGTATRDLEARFDSQWDMLLGGEKVIASEGRILKPTFVLPSTLARFGKQLVAKDAYHQEATEEHPAGYLLDGLVTPSTLVKQPSLTITRQNLQTGEPEEQTVIITPRDAPWLESDQVFVVSAMPFQLLASGSQWRNYASTRELVAELNNPTTDLSADVRVAVHTRVLQPAMDVTLVMLGLPLMFSRKSRNVFLSMGICLLAVLAFSLVALACQSLGGLSLLSPPMAAWLPLMLFVPLAVAMSGALRT